MESIRLCLGAAFIALAACSGDPARPDAQVFNYDFSCLGNSAPTTATDTVSASGIVQEAYSDHGTPSLANVEGATLYACTVGAATCDETTHDAVGTSAADGTYTVGPKVTGGTPYNGYLLVSHLGDRTTYLVPPSPLENDKTGVLIPILQNAFVAQLAALGLTQDATKAILGLQITDCTDAPMNDRMNIELSVKQNGSDVLMTSVISASQFSEEFGGDYFILNVPVGPTEVGATYKGMTMRGLTVTMVAGTSTVTRIRPGY
jgi:hypothetical protein